MKKRILKTALPLIAVALVGVAIATSCEKEKTDDQEKTINIRHYDVPFGLTSDKLTLDSLYVINNYDDYINILGNGELIAELPILNFNKKTLFVMCGNAPCVIDRIDKLTQVRKDSYRLDVTLEEGTCLSIDPWNMFFTTDFKINSKQVVTYINGKKI